MKLESLLKVKAKDKKRMGRGLGSGKGKTGGRGMKGQKARGKIPLTFIGGTLPLYRKLPLRKGQGNSKVSPKFLAVNLNQLSNLKPKTVVDIDKLVESGIISQKDSEGGVKILGQGEIKVALNFKLPLSRSAKQKIEKAGGSSSV